jgi:hypothetical protein
VLPSAAGLLTMAVGNNNGPGKLVLERELPEVALASIELSNELDSESTIEGSADCAIVGNGSAIFVEAILLTESSIDSVGWLNPLRMLSVDMPSIVVCVKVLGMLVKVLLLDDTMSMVCDALSTAVKNELAISSPELVGSSILMLPDFEVNNAVDCTSGTMIEILADRVDSMIGSPVETV